MPRQPTSEEVKLYNLRAHVDRKVHLTRLCELELAILRTDPEGSRKAKEELRIKGHSSDLACSLPTEQNSRKDFLCQCEKQVESSARNLAEYVRLSLQMH